MTGNTEIAVTKEEPPKHSLPNLFSFFPKFDFQLPFLPPKPKPKPKPKSEPQAAKPEHEPPKPIVVRFPKSQGAVVSSSSLQVESDHSSAAKTSNPFVIWQVYAVGAIMISTWIWARWNERKGRGGSSNDERAEGSHSNDDNH
ncbi:uncharacterized protein LOC109789446 [Cajanus cajan]|uniref:Uncharacterized protein n=1 Tax=Cajanus cajan TaxID=3821 RepID=A0A151R6Z4_CAJCA|nr:uncharacterized protein LOC109789446 [Cajanus cajan]KYP38390.1 hypothetical protein KK1_040373 [Cajanus cajan]